MEELTCDVLIVGGGVAGSAVAASLRNSGLKIILVEPRISGQDLNRGDVLYPASVEILNHWQALDTIKKKGSIEFQKIGAIHKEKVLLEIDLTKINANFPFSLSLDHYLIEEGLLEFASSENMQILKGFVVKELIQSENNCQGAIVVGQGKELKVTCKLLVGADGRKSQIRDKVSPETQITDFDYECLVSWAPLKEDFRSGAYLYINLPYKVLAQLLPGRRLRIAQYVPIGRGKELMALPAELKKQHLEEVSPEFSKIDADFKGEYIYSLHSLNSKKYWQENIVLVGDAAHEVHPLSSQGIGMALADAFVLGKVLGYSLEDLSEKLAKYERVRKPTTTQIVNNSNLLANIVGNQNTLTEEIENLLVEMTEHFSILGKLLSVELSSLEYKSLESVPRVD